MAYAAQQSKIVLSGPFAILTHQVNGVLELVLLLFKWRHWAGCVSDVSAYCDGRQDHLSLLHQYLYRTYWRWQYNFSYGWNIS